jgi:hypothetical protein
MVEVMEVSKGREKRGSQCEMLVVGMERWLLVLDTGTRERVSGNLV